VGLLLHAHHTHDTRTRYTHDTLVHRAPARR
jgi:hypothetical protein